MEWGAGGAGTFKRGAVWRVVPSPAGVLEKERPVGSSEASSFGEGQAWVHCHSHRLVGDPEKAPFLQQRNEGTPANASVDRTLLSTALHA